MKAPSRPSPGRLCHSLPASKLNIQISDDPGLDKIFKLTFEYNLAGFLRFDILFREHCKMLLVQCGCLPEHLRGDGTSCRGRHTVRFTFGNQGAEHGQTLSSGKLTVAED